MCIPVYTPWLLGYIDVAQTFLIILTMGGFFLGRLCINLYVCALYIEKSKMIFYSPPPLSRTNFYLLGVILSPIENAWVTMLVISKVRQRF